MSSPLSTILVILWCLYLVSCQYDDSSQSAEIDGESVLATYPQQGTITVEELKKYLLTVPVGDRWSSEEPLGHYKSVIRRLVVNKQLLSEALLSTADKQSQYLLEKNNLLRTTYARSYLLNKGINFEPDEATLLAHYDDHKEEYILPEKRNVYHVFKSVQSADAESTLERIRQRIVTGESIKLLARKFSESESRYKDGFIGLVGKGIFPEDFDEVVFNLKENVPSEVISTKDGFHIFMVSDILSAQNYTFDQVKQKILQSIGLEYMVDVIQQNAISLGLPDNFMVVTSEQLAELLVKKDPLLPVFQAGDKRLSAGGLQYFISDWLSRTKTTKNMKDMVYLMLKQQAYSEVIYQHMLDNGMDIPKHDKEILDQSLEALLIKGFTQSKIRAYVNQNPERLKDYYDKNTMRFASPIKLNLQVLQIPKTAGINLMPMLENNTHDLNTGAATLLSLADKYQGSTLRQLGLQSVNDLATISPKFGEFTFTLEVSQHSAPFTDDNSYFIAHLIDKKPAKKRPLALVREQVLDAYINDNKTFIFAEISESLLQDLSFNEPILKTLIDQSAAIE